MAGHDSADTGGPTTSSARRRPGRQRSGGMLLPTAVLIVAALIIGLSLLSRSRRQQEPVRMEPTPAVEAPGFPQLPAAPTPSPTPSPTPPLVAQSVQWRPQPPSPSPTPTLAPASTPRPRPTPTPTPRVSECVRIRWSGGQSGTNLAQILITVEAENHCGRELDVDEVWIWAAGYRDGSIVHSTQGHLFRPLRAGFPEETTLVLPGSVSWYDEVVVRVYGPDEIR